MRKRGKGTDLQTNQLRQLKSYNVLEMDSCNMLNKEQYVHVLVATGREVTAFPS